MNEPLTIKVKYHTDIYELKQVSIGDAIDVRAAESICLKQFEYAQIPLGFSCKLPEGYCALLLPRSSTYKKYKILQTNSVGVVDSSYCGDKDIWAMPVVALENTYIPKNERIAQFMIIPKMPTVNFEIVDDLQSENRGGFGSSGRT